MVCCTWFIVCDGVCHGVVWCCGVHSGVVATGVVVYGVWCVRHVACGVWLWCVLMAQPPHLPHATLSAPPVALYAVGSAPLRRSTMLYSALAMPTATTHELSRPAGLHSGPRV